MCIVVNQTMRKVTWTSIIVFVSILKAVTPQDETKLYDGYLFERFDDIGLTSSEAEKQCTDRGAWLFEPKTDEMFNELTDNFIPANDGYYLMGLRRLDGEWRWSDYSDPTTTHWANTNEPNDIGQDCGFVNNRKWLSVVCTAPQIRYVCQSLQPPLSSIILYGNLLERFAEELPNYATAKDRCVMRGAQLVEIKDKTIDEKIIQWIGSDTSSYLMGIQYSTINNVWEYSSDNTAITYENWKTDEGDDPNQDCACISSDGWVDEDCTGGTFKYICQSYPSEATIEGDLLEKFDNEIGNAAARSRCSLWNGSLVDMKTSTYNNVVQNLIGNGVFYHIGLKYFDGAYRWTDGSAATYDDWATGEGTDIGKDCVRTDQNTWRDTVCGGPIGYICQSTAYCTGNSGTCQNGGSCVSYRWCECADGFYGDTCSSNEYCPNNVNPCQNGGSCENMPGTDPYYKCNCKPGYFNVTCSSDEYCPNNPDTCQNGSCKNTQGEDPYYECDCMPGFFGYNCSNDQYCPNNVNPCQNGGSCENSPEIFPYYECACKPGYFNDTCSSNEYCPNNPNPCKNNGSCENTPGEDPYYECDCMPGFFGYNCSSDEYCPNNVVNPCQNGGSCENSPGTFPYYECACTPGYFNDICSSDEYCPNNPNPCQNGICENTPKQPPYYECDCMPGFFGYNCFSDQYCDYSQNPCLNGGTCQSIPLVDPYYECICVQGYSGNICETEYGTPEIISAWGEPCTDNGKINVTWKPHTAIRHNYQITLLNSSEAYNDYGETFPTDNHVQTLIIEDLYPDSQYDIMITACPTDCIAELSDNANATTGIGLPGKIVTATVSQNYETNYCEVSWTWPESISQKNVEMFQVNYQATFVHKPPSSDITTINVDVSVNPPKLTYNLKMEPNRIYNFDVLAVSCAGSGPETSATGKCITDSDAPDYVEEPNLLDENPGSTRDMKIILPNEINGPISCVFVVVKNGPIDTHDVFDIVKLRHVSSEALKDKIPNGEEYLAVAIKRYEFSESSMTVNLGDEITSGCDVADNSANNSVNYYDAKNWQLQIGNTYSTYVVTTSPNEEETVLFQQSSVEEFENGSSNPGTDKAWIAGVVVGIIALATVVVGAIFYTKRRHQSENRESSLTSSKSTSRDNTDLYETTGYQTAGNPDISPVKHNDIDQQHIYSTIPGVGYENVVLQNKDSDDA